MKSGNLQIPIWLHADSWSKSLILVIYSVAGVLGAGHLNHTHCITISLFASTSLLLLLPTSPQALTFSLTLFIAILFELDYAPLEHRKNYRNKGTKNVFCKNKHNVGMEQCVFKYACSLAWKTSWWKNFTNKEGASLTLQPTYSPHKLTFTSV